MAVGIKANNVVPLKGVSWEDLFAIDAGGLTNATRDNFFVEIVGNDKYTYAKCLYTGTGALTIAELNKLPIGSTILATGITAPTLYLKTAATTWKSQAVNT